MKLGGRPSSGSSGNQRTKQKYSGSSRVEKKEMDLENI